MLNESPDGTVRVCEHCLQAGHIDERLATHAQQLEEQAQKTRSLIGRLKVPTYEEWIAEEERVDAERIAEGEEPYWRQRKDCALSSDGTATLPQSDRV